MSVIGSTFETKEPDLLSVLEQIHSGAIQLPDFQRGWVWDDEHIRSLIASISVGYPIGAIMFLETGGDGIRFKPRPVAGSVLETHVEPQKLILDGQQRMTSLYRALKSGLPVETRNDKGKDIERVYYMDIVASLDVEIDREDAVVSLPPSRMILTNFNREVEFDISTSEKEYAGHHIPLEALIDDDTWNSWAAGYREHHDYNKDLMRQLDAFQSQVRSNFVRYRVPIIELTKATPRDAVCQVFEKVNTGGVTLTVFELMTATFAAEEFDLRKDWKARHAKLKSDEILKDVSETDFLQAVTLLARYRAHKRKGTSISCKRKDILNLELVEYRTGADEIQHGLVKAAKLLVREKIFNAKNLPYSTQLIPLSVLCAILDNRFEEENVKQKLARWYWCGVFGELYGSNTATRFARDVAEVVAWTEGGEEPSSFRDASFNPTRLLSLQTRNSAAYKGVMALLIDRGSRDFISGDSIELNNFFNEAVDIHHIFPRAYCQKNDFPRRKWNSVVNKAPLTSRTNRVLGGQAPSRYLKRIENNEQVAPEELRQILKTHEIEPEPLYNDEFGEFILRRASSLLDLIENAMGKPVSGRDSDEVVDEFGGSLASIADPAPAVNLLDE